MAGEAARDATPMARLRLQPVGEHWQARIDNGLAGPLQIELRAAPGHPVEGLPVESLLQGDSSLVVGHLPAPIDGRMLDLRLQSVPGNPAAQAEDVAYRLPFDAARAKKLLADAGYPDGFTLSLLCSNDMFVNEEELCQAAASMWARIGVKATLASGPRSLQNPKRSRGE
ncbi:hypothetical protein G6F57_020994 [Rhizopus arrhizus]|nr:hypothetical protein G6F57_020994 [Rhizopus arrhizus]